METVEKLIPQVLSEEIILQKYGKIVKNRIFQDPDGEKRDFIVWGGKVDPVIILAITTDKKVIALKMFRRAANEISLEIPGGNPNTEETIETSVSREFSEETGYKAGKIIHLGPSLWFEPASCTTAYVPFLLVGCEKIKKQKLDETEKNEGMEINLIPVKEWIKMIYSGDIRDSKTIAVTFLALPHLGLKI